MRAQVGIAQYIHLSSFVWIFYQDWYFPCNESYLAWAVAVWCPQRQKCSGSRWKWLSAGLCQLSCCCCFHYVLCYLSLSVIVPPTFMTSCGVLSGAEVVPVGSLVGQATIVGVLYPACLGVMDRSYIWRPVSKKCTWHDWHCVCPNTIFFHQLMKTLALNPLTLI